MTRLREYWTLGKRGDGGWMVLSIEQDLEGAHNLEDEIVASPWGDDQRLRDEALVEGAVADKVLDGYKVSDVADLDFDGDARAAALDLSLADGRFAPDVLEAAVRAAVSGWTEAVDGEDDALLALAAPEAAQNLLYPGNSGGKRRLVVRGARVRALRIVALDAAAEPPTMTVEVDVSGRRYVQDRDTAGIVSGSDTREANFTERWLMSLSGDDRNPWRIVDASAPKPSGARS
jgi:predicted lipid-binding transport protein (Tim44 family)